MNTHIDQTLEHNNTPKIQSSEYLNDDSYRTFMNSIENIVGFMNTSNQKRLYWVWGSGLIKTIIDAIPEDFLYQKDASSVITLPDNFTGTLSWVLYAFRFFFNLTLLIYHTLATNPEHPEFNWQDRLEKQWRDKKFALLNDLIWGPANMVCFFFLNAKTGLGMWGDFLTLGLLLFDVSMTIWGYAEKEEKYLAKMQRIENMIQKKTNEINSHIKNGDAIQKDIAQSELDALKIKRLQYTAKWEAAQKELLLNLLYSIALVVAFALIIGGSAFPPLAIVGTVLCFTFTILNNSFGVGLELYDALSAEEKAQTQFNYMGGNRMEAEKIPLTPDLSILQADINYQHELALYKTLQLIQVIVVQLLVPPLVLASLVFMPTGVGVAIIIIAACLAICSSLLVNEFNPGERSSYKPTLFAPDKTNKDLDQPDNCLEYQII